VVVRDSARLNGLTSLSITKLDVLTGLETLKICVAYDLEGRRIQSRPASLTKLARCKPIYEELPGWKEEISSVRERNQLPAETKAYLKRIEEMTEVPLSIISVGPGREQTIVVKDPFATSRS
jgi:adenylosuccinate synthase